jgi:hypothetical protein
VRALVVVAAVSQMIVAIVLAVGDGSTPVPSRAVTAVGASGPAEAVPVTTTTTMPPVVVSVPAVAAPAPLPSPTVATAAVHGVIGAGPGGKARADLRDEAGNTWHSEADSRGGYRFDGLPPGRYQLILSAESAGAQCGSDGTCVGTGLSISRRVLELGPGQEVREDYSAYGPTGPAPPPAPVTPSTTVVVPPSTTTTSTTAPR